MPCRAGQGSASFSKTAESKSTTTRWSEPSGRWPSIARTHYSPARDGGAEHWAVIASLIETCKLLGVEPHTYLADIITRIVNGHPQSRLDDLLPWAYPTMPQLKAVA